MASAKLANSTVNHSHSVICRLNLNAEAPRSSSTVVMTLPTSTTNMTGLAIILGGFSLRTESRTARRTIFHSQIAFCLAILLSYRLKDLPCALKQMLQDRPQTQGREESERADDQDHSDQQHGEQRRCNRKRSERRRNILFLR